MMFVVNNADSVILKLLTYYVLFVFINANLIVEFLVFD